MNWFTSKDKKERLKERYCKLMRRAYKIAPKDKAKSDYLNREALKIREQLQQLD